MFSTLAPQISVGTGVAGRVIHRVGDFCMENYHEVVKHLTHSSRLDNCMPVSMWSRCAHFSSLKLMASHKHCIIVTPVSADRTPRNLACHQHALVAPWATVTLLNVWSTTRCTGSCISLQCCSSVPYTQLFPLQPAPLRSLVTYNPAKLLNTELNQNQ